jgi:hypothetical protein
MGMKAVLAEEGGLRVTVGKIWPNGQANDPSDTPSVQLQGPTFRDVVGHFWNDITLVKVWTLFKSGDQSIEGPVTTITEDQAGSIDATEDHTKLLDIVSAEVDWRLRSDVRCVPVQ